MASFFKVRKIHFCNSSLEADRKSHKQRQNVMDIFPDKPQFAIKTVRVLQVRDGMAGEDALEWPIAEGPMANVVDQKKWSMLGLWRTI